MSNVGHEIILWSLQMYRRLSRRATYLATANGFQHLFWHPALIETLRDISQHVVRLQHTPALVQVEALRHPAQQWVASPWSGWRCVFCAPYENTAPSHRITRQLDPWPGWKPSFGGVCMHPRCDPAKPPVQCGQSWALRRWQQATPPCRWDWPLGWDHRMVAYGSRIHPWPMALCGPTSARGSAWVHRMRSYHDWHPGTLRMAAAVLIWNPKWDWPAIPLMDAGIFGSFFIWFWSWIESFLPCRTQFWLGRQAALWTKKELLIHLLSWTVWQYVHVKTFWWTWRACCCHCTHHICCVMDLWVGGMMMMMMMMGGLCGAWMLACILSWVGTVHIYTIWRDWQTTWQHMWNLMNRKGLYALGSLTCTRNGWLNLVLTTCSACQRVWATLLMECTSLKLHYLTNCRMHHPCFDIGRVRGNRCAIFPSWTGIASDFALMSACVWNKKCIRLPNKPCRFLFK